MRCCKRVKNHNKRSYKNILDLDNLTIRLIYTESSCQRHLSSSVFSTPSTKDTNRPNQILPTNKFARISWYFKFFFIYLYLLFIYFSCIHEKCHHSSSVNNSIDGSCDLNVIRLELNILRLSSVWFGKRFNAIIAFSLQTNCCTPNQYILWMIDCNGGLSEVKHVFVIATESCCQIWNFFVNKSFSFQRWLCCYFLALFSCRSL